MIYKNCCWIKKKEDENCVIQKKNQILNSIEKYVDLDM